MPNKKCEIIFYTCIYTQKYPEIWGHVIKLWEHFTSYVILKKNFSHKLLTLNQMQGRVRIEMFQYKIHFLDLKNV